MVPPLVGVAVNVTDWPAHAGLEPEVTAILTDAGVLLVVVKVTMLDVAVLGLAHDELEVISTDTASPLAGVNVYVELLVPTLLLPTFH